MPDENETVVIEMAPDDRIRLYGQVTAQMEKLGHNPCDYNSLNLGIDLPADLPADWPVGEKSQPSMPQLVVVARKLDMRIIITDLILIPRKTDV